MTDSETVVRLHQELDAARRELTNTRRVLWCLVASFGGSARVFRDRLEKFSTDARLRFTPSNVDGSILIETDKPNDDAKS